MAPIKSYTDIEQSRKLAEILPIESADMWWLYITAQGKRVAMMHEEPDPHYLTRMESCGIKDAAIRCWSLAALLDLMICPNLEEYIEGVWNLTAFTDESLRTPIELQDCESAVDACYEMILKLYELKML